MVKNGFPETKTHISKELGLLLGIVLRLGPWE
jgi:hypothetical protein